MKNFINRPVPRLLRYEVLLKDILEMTPPGHDDLDTVPGVLDVIKELEKEAESRVVLAKRKVELWRYNANLVFKAGESIVCFRLIFKAEAFDANFQQDMDLLNENRSLIHTGKFLRQPDTGFEWSGWTELFALLFDNYRRGIERGFFSKSHESPVVVMTRPKEKNGVTKYHVYRRVSHIKFRTPPQVLTFGISPSLWTFSPWRRSRILRPT